MARNFGRVSEIRIPPQSTGPRILNSIYQSVTLSSIGGTVVVGQNIVGQTSGGTGVIEVINGNDILVDFNPESPVQSFIDGETADINNAAFTATINSPVDVYANATHVIDGENPHHAQRVGYDGSAHIRYSEGEQLLDAFGVTMTTSRQILGAWNFQYDDAVPGLSQVATGSATGTHLPNESALRVDCTTGATDSYEVQTHRYFPYTPGVGREALFTLACGDSGKTDNTRRWGMYDDDNGVFFELDDTTLYVVLRSNVTGTPVDTRIAQANWNRDVLDGTGGNDNRSLVNLDITKANIYWIDYAWLGVGRVRFGIYTPDGERAPCHSIENSNANTGPYMTTGSLPAKSENFNSGVTSGTSSLKLICSSVIDSKVQQSSAVPPTYGTSGINVSVDNTENLLCNVRSATTFNSITNRLISTALKGTVMSETAPVIVKVYQQATIGGTPSWNAPTASSPLEIDTAGTFSGGEEVATFLVGVNEGISEDLSFLQTHTLADGSASITYTVTAQGLGATTDVSWAIVWFDQG